MNTWGFGGEDSVERPLAFCEAQNAGGSRILEGCLRFAKQNELAERTGLEPATPGVTGRYSNQLNYRSISGGC